MPHNPTHPPSESVDVRTAGCGHPNHQRLMAAGCRTLRNPWSTPLPAASLEGAATNWILEEHVWLSGARDPTMETRLGNSS